ncbi:MAG: amidohydrolase [Alphaproteobacteria bacterium]|nr:amidohydrolase [Alphaproteobacteria bacterium]
MSAIPAPRAPHAGADLILVGGKIITIDPAFRLAEAIAIKDGRILAVGGSDEIRALADATSEIRTLDGRAVMPGLIDGHAHLDREGLKPVFPSLAGARSIDDILQRIEALVKERGRGEWIVTMPIGEPPYYWDVPDNLREKRYPTRRDLDRVAPDNPVYIKPIWGFWRHVLPLVSIANSRALAAAGIGRDTPAPCPSVTFERDEAGDPTGVIVENTFMPVVELGYFHTMPRFTPADRAAGLERAMRIYNATGTTSVLEEHGAAQELIAAWQAVHDKGAQSVRAHLVHSPSWKSAPAAGIAPMVAGWASWLGRGGLGDDWLRVEGLYAELGPSLENDWRAKAAPYTGWAGFFYDTGRPREEMKTLMVEAARHDVRMVALSMNFLDLYEEVDRIVPIGGRRWIIGHLNTATPDQIRRIRDLGLVMTTHTNRYVFKEGHLTRQEIGPGDARLISPLASLRAAGIRLGLATDNVPTSLFHPVWHAVTRWNRYSEDAIEPTEAVSREDALRMATIDGAYLTFDEDRKGSLEPGKLADLVVLSDDPLLCPTDTIKDIVAETTIVGGAIVYEREAR